MHYKNWTIKLISFIFINIILILALLYFFKITMFSYSDRMPNIRKVSKEYRLNIVQDYINYKFKQGTTYDIVIGDSQFYGFKQYEKDTFPYLLKKEFSNKNIINLSIVDGTERDLNLILQILKDKKVKINRIIYNFNLSHFSTILLNDKLPSQSLNTFSNLYTLKLQKDYWTSFIEKTFLEKKYSQRYDTRKYDINRYNITNKNDKNFEYLLKNMQSLSKKVLIILSPHSISSLENSNYDIQKFKKNITKYKNIISKTNCETLDLTFEFNKSCFLDILHLSIHGHKEITQSILKYYKRSE